MPIIVTNFHINYVLFIKAVNKMVLLFSFVLEYKPALEGRAIINLQMSDTFAAYQDINASCNVKPTAELLTNRGVIYQVDSPKLSH